MVGRVLMLLNEVHMNNYNNILVFNKRESLSPFNFFVCPPFNYNLVISNY